VPSILSLGIERKSYDGNGIQTVNITHRLRVSYKIVEADAGGAVRGDTVLAEKNDRQTDGLQTEDTDVVNELLDDASEQLAEAIVKSGETLPDQVAPVAQVDFKVSCTMTDPRQQPIMVSAMSIGPDNQLVATNQPIAVQPLDVTVELDGAAIGSAPGEFKARPGLHKLRLSREGFADWSRTINVYDGQTLRVALQMSPAGYAEWLSTTAFLADLDNTRKLTDAQVKLVEGFAKFCSESHYRVDTKENVHITKNSIF
jgi:hypothetical protein